MIVLVKNIENPKQRIIGIGFNISRISPKVKWISIYLWKKVIEIWFGDRRYMQDIIEAYK